MSTPTNEQRKQVAALAQRLDDSLHGSPWYGTPVFQLLTTIDPDNAFRKAGNYPHSPAALLYHMIAWATFTLHRVKGLADYDSETMEAIDWQVLDPRVHTWEKGLAEFRNVHRQLLETLQEKNDTWLTTKVMYRDYDVAFLLEGLIQHNIYHSGQFALLGKLQ